MKTIVIALVTLVFLTSAAVAGQPQYGSGVYSPERGVICDTMGKWCADGTGLSASWTSQYFGADAAAKLDEVVQSAFGFSNHVKCAITTQSCSGGSAAGKMQAMLFRSAAASPAPAAPAGSGQSEFGAGVYSPQPGVICDGMAKWCADGTGLSASWTGHYFGGAAAGKLVGAAQEVFGFSNNVNCDISSQSCSGGSEEVANMMTKALFGE